MKKAWPAADTQRLLAGLVAKVYTEGEPASIDEGPYCPRCLSSRIKTGRSAHNRLLKSLSMFFYALALPLPQQHLCENCRLRWPV